MFLSKNIKHLLYISISIIIILTGCYQPVLNDNSSISRPNVNNENTALGDPLWNVNNIDTDQHFQLERECYNLSYNNEIHSPNWVSWHLDKDDIHGVNRIDSFKADDMLPKEWYKVDENSFKRSGFHRGHMCPSGDRLDSYESNEETFYMTNMVPQCPQNNSGAWETFEAYIREVHISKGMEAYIICGPYGTGGENKYHNIVSKLQAYATNEYGNHKTIDINVPSNIWKVVIILPDKSGDDIKRITKETEIIAVWMPNDYSCDYYDFNEYITSVDFVEEMTGYDFFSSIPDDIENVLEAKIHDPITYEHVKPWEH